MLYYNTSIIQEGLDAGISTKKKISTKSNVMGRSSGRVRAKLTRDKNKRKINNPIMRNS